MRLLCIACVVMLATFSGGCGSSEPEPEPDVVVVDQIENLKDGYSHSWKLDPGTYKAEMTATGDGATVEWIGSSCPTSDATNSYSITCEMTQTGQLVVANPSAFGMGAGATVTVKVTKLGQ